jgi:transcriptional regulator with XRE-family HTH domain
MSAPQIHGKRRSFSVSDALDALGEDLKTIREEDGLTWLDVGRVLGKSDDRAADYAKGISEMPVSAFLLGCREWNGRFAGRVMAMIGKQIGPLDSADMSDNERLAKLLHLAHLLSLALLNDGVVDDDELRGIGSADLDETIAGLMALRTRRQKLDPPSTQLRAVGEN